MKRLLSLILSVAMLLSLSPLTFAADANYGTNLALGKPVDYAGSITAGFVATNLTDGNPGSTAAAGSSSDKKICGTGMWMVVDLGGLYELERVILYTRQDLDASWARQGLGVAYGVEADYSDMKSLGEKPGAGDFKSTLNVKIADAPVARYVAMYCFKAGAGNVAGELEVYGSPYTGEGTGDFLDTKTPAQRNATKLLYNLGIMDGISKTEFGVDDLITRGEAAEIMCKVAGINEPSGYRDEFLDVTADHPYANYIQAGVDNGFISKDTHFRPDDYLLGYELLKMILCVNGHYEKPVYGNLYPSKIIGIANDLDLLENSGTDGWSNIGKGSAAVVLYNAFLSNKFVYQNGMFVETSKTLLEDSYGYELRTGVVTGNAVTKLDVPQDTVNLNNVEIGGESFTDNLGLGTDFLGERVYYLFDKEDYSVVTMWSDEAKNKTVTIKGEDVAPTSTMTALEEYVDEEGTKKNRYKIDPDGYTIKNDVADAGVTAADFAVENGYVTLLDNDGDDIYEVVKVYDPEIIVVDSAYQDTFSQTISIADKAGNTPLDYDYELLNILNAQGKQASVDNLPGSLAYVYASVNEAVVNIQIMPEAIEAVATGKSGDAIKLDGVNYQKTAYFERVYDADVEIGKSATFYTDLEGNLVAVLDVSTQGKSQVIAVIQKFIIDPGSEEYAIKVYDETGSSRDLKVGDVVVVNGEKKTLGELADIQSTLVGKLAYATITEDNVLKVLTTEDETLVEETDLTVTGYCTGSAIYDAHTFKCNVNADAPIFTIPVDIVTGLPITDADYAALYSVRKMGNVFKKMTSTNTDYSVYGLDEYKAPTLLMREVPYDTASKTFEPCNNIMAEKTACVVDTVRQNVDQYGELSYTITGYAIDSGKAVKFTTEPGLEYAVNYAKLADRNGFPAVTSYGNTVSYLYNHRGIKKEGFITLDGYENYLVPFVSKTDAEGNVIPGLKQGDIVRYCKDGGSNVKEIDVIAEKEDFSGDSKVIYSVGNDPIRILSTLRLQRTTVQQIKEGYILFDTAGVTESIKLSAFTGSIVVIENGKIETYPMSSAGVCLEAGDKILVHTSAWDHVSIIALKD